VFVDFDEEEEQRNRREVWCYSIVLVIGRGGISHRNM